MTQKGEVMESLHKLEELVQQIIEDAKKCKEKGVYSRGRSARKSLSELGKLSKVIRAEILDQMHKIEHEKSGSDLSFEEWQQARKK